VFNHKCGHRLRCQSQTIGLGNQKVFLQAASTSCGRTCDSPCLTGLCGVNFLSVPPADNRAAQPHMQILEMGIMIASMKMPVCGEQCILPYCCICGLAQHYIECLDLPADAVQTSRL